MCGMNDHGLLVAKQGLRTEPLVARDVVDDGEIELSVEQRGDRTGRVLDGNPDIDVRKPLPDLLEQRRQPVIARVALRAHAELAATLPGHLHDRGLRTGDLIEHLVGSAQQHQTCGGWQHATPGSKEQRRSEPVFDLSQLMTDG